MSSLVKKNLKNRGNLITLIKLNNLIKGERDPLYNLKNNNIIVIKGTAKGSTDVVSDREDYDKESENQLGRSNIYEEVPNDTKRLKNIILKTL